jgi:hypothetical protein
MAAHGDKPMTVDRSYRRREYIHELTAETYALLTRERIHGRPGQPSWLPNEIYQLIARIGT